MSPSKLRDLLNSLSNPKPKAKVLIPWIRGQREVDGFHLDDDGNLVLDLKQGIIQDKKEEK